MEFLSNQGFGSASILRDFETTQKRKGVHDKKYKSNYACNAGI